MTKEEKVLYASSLLQEAGVDFKIGKVSYENTTSENPALNNAAKQFNDALLDEQAKKIKMLSNQKEELMKIVASRNTEIEQLAKKANKYDVLRKQFAHLSKVLHRKNQMIEELRADGSKHLRDKIDTFNENQELEKVIKEKDEVIDDISKELRACKVKEEKLIASIKEYQKSASEIDWKRNAEAIQLYVSRASQERLWHIVNQDVCNEKELSFVVKHGDKRVKYALRFDGNDVIYECSDPDKHHPAPKKKSRSVIDNPDEIVIEEAVNRIREALKNGHTVVVDYDDAADIINTQL